MPHTRSKLGPVFRAGEVAKGRAHILELEHAHAADRRQGPGVQAQIQTQITELIRCRLQKQQGGGLVYGWDSGVHDA
jgi:hypothetical protein